MLVQEPVQAAIWHCLNHYAYGDATFLAERLLAEVDSDESLFLLATCYYRSGKLNQAYDVLQAKGLRTPQNRYLMARCCKDLNKLMEAETILNGDTLDPRKERSVEDVVNDFGDAASFAYQLLGSIYSTTERVPKAIDVERKALRLNPFLWKSFEGLCNMGDAPDPQKVFSVSHLENFNHCHGAHNIINLVNNNQQQLQQLNTESAQQQQQQQQLPPTNLAATPVQSLPQPQFQTPPVIPLLTVTPTIMETTPSSNNMISTPMGNNVSMSSSRFMSGITTLNYSTDCDSPSGNNGKPVTMMPPPLRMKKVHQKLQQQLHHQQQQQQQASPPPVPIDNSFYTPTFGTLLNQGTAPRTCNRINFSDISLSSSSSVIQLQLNFSSSLVDLSTSNATSTPPAALSNSNAAVLESALTNATNNEKKLSLRSIMAASKENPLKPNLFGQSPNISPSAASQIVRRSSRLFGSTRSVKENSKTPNNNNPSSTTVNAPTKNRVAPKSPSRKSKSRNANNNNKNNEIADKNEKNKNEILKEDQKAAGQQQQQQQTAAAQTAAAVAAAAAAQAAMVGINLGLQALVIQKTSLEGLMSLLRQFGAAYLELSRYNCRKSIALFDDIVPHHRNKGWVLGLMGKNYFELGEYKEAKKYFQEVRDKEPYRLDHMEYYSTALWHLQEEIELSSLAQELTRIDKNSPQAWCAAGNCFSHQKEHENAIKFFQRAVQVQPNFAYAYTLLGHEYVMIEELDKALACFRSAVRVDPRHYNAWYGIGLTYYKQEAYKLTEIYYRKALAINRQSPILMCHVAVVQHALQKTDKALETLNNAIKAAPKNPLCKFERASILFASERYKEALEELNELKEIVPKESPVYFLSGKVHSKLNNSHMALMHFSWAMDLDPKGANSQIKDALDPTMNRATQDETNVQHNDDDLMQIARPAEDFQDMSQSFHPEGGASTSQESLDVTPLPRIISDDSL